VLKDARANEWFQPALRYQIDPSVNEALKFHLELADANQPRPWTRLELNQEVQVAVGVEAESRAEPKSSNSRTP
jgi:hypothetical protein